MAQTKRIICVSHLTGAEGEAVARGVAERLGLRYLDEEIIETAAEWVDLDPSMVGEVERRKSLMTRIGESMRGQALPSRPDTASQRRSSAVHRETPADEDLRTVIRDAIRETAEQGNVVIASHAASMALAGRQDVVRVLVTASEETRLRRISAARNLDQERAEKVLAEQDAARADYMKRFYRVDVELPTHYDLVVNTDNLPPERAVDLISLAAGET
jgi:cytidylate kinase